MLIRTHPNLFNTSMLPLPWNRLLRAFRASVPGMPDAPACARAEHLAARPSCPAPVRRSAPPATARQNRSLLRVIRILDPGQQGSAGRILMSGCMADVCAELDRMVEREAALQARS